MGLCLAVLPTEGGRLREQALPHPLPPRCLNSYTSSPWAWTLPHPRDFPFFSLLFCFCLITFTWPVLPCPGPVHPSCVLHFLMGLCVPGIHCMAELHSSPLVFLFMPPPFFSGVGFGTQGLAHVKKLYYSGLEKWLRG